MKKNGTLNSNVPKKFRSLSMLEARKKILKDLKESGDLISEKDHMITIPRSDRTGVTLEPFLTEQWYLKSNEMASKAKKLIQNRQIKLIPRNWENTFFSWMNEIRDWCISRQLWWGHRIPAWYDSDKNIYVGRNISEVRKKYGLSNKIKLKQDEDVLDTWFSSQLWTFATLGWPKNTRRLKKFH